MLTNNDLDQISGKGIDTSKVNMQIEQFKHGFPFMDIQKPATVGDGIIRLSDDIKKGFIDEYNKITTSGAIVQKFVPASGAATRMFKDLFTYVSADTETQKAMEANGPIHDFLAHIQHFAFFKDLQKICKVDLKNNEEVFANGPLIVDTLISDKGLKYGNYPKGVLKFHLSDVRDTTPIEEHLIEGALYGKSNHNEVHIHFTVSPAHQSLFQNLVSQKIELYETKFDVQYKITYSTQKSSTDTIAVNTDNTPFRTDNGKLLFRPGGHGALIENLNEINADIIFIKNIDNVVPEFRLQSTIDYKKALAGVLSFYQNKIFGILNKIDNHPISNEDIDDILNFMQVDLFITIPEDIKSHNREEIIHFIQTKLDRPIRVCGMVKNQGEPGGGPFWGIGKNGETSLQIVESSQIDLKNPKKAELMKQSSHFNPVDLICGVKNHKGDKFNLLDFVDPKTGFISQKSMNGKDLKALELPGLWNGAMSDWITIFAEVPIETFNPVKTINDLLREQHQLEKVSSH